MSRIRTIKPQFFTDDDVGALTPLARLLFIGLWTEADREGRLEDRPKQIRARLLPYDDADMDALLAELERGRFIVRYAVEARRLIQVRSFARHQHVHIKEPASTIPPPLDGNDANPVPAPCEAGSGTVPESGEHRFGREEGKGREGKGKEGRGKVPSGLCPDGHDAPSLPDALRAALIAAWTRTYGTGPSWTDDSRAWTELASKVIAARLDASDVERRFAAYLRDDSQASEGHRLMTFAWRLDRYAGQPKSVEADERERVLARLARLIDAGNVPLAADLARRLSERDDWTADQRARLDELRERLSVEREAVC